MTHLVSGGNPPLHQLLVTLFLNCYKVLSWNLPEAFWLVLVTPRTFRSSSSMEKNQGCGIVLFLLLQEG